MKHGVLNVKLAI